MNDRGQTVLDFAVGVSVFLIVVAFVLTFVPGMVEPFQESTQQETAAADRLADQLAADQLVENVSTPYVLDRGCVAGFFAQDSSDVTGTNLYDSDDCSFNISKSVSTRLATTGSGLDVRVRLIADVNDNGSPDLLCLDADGAGSSNPERSDPIVGTDDPDDSSDDCDVSSSDDIAFQTTNDPPSDSSSVVAARRHVTIEGGFADGSNGATLVVEVW